MKLFCPDCGSPIPAADVDLPSSSAKCRRCDTVFAFGDQLRQEGPRRPPPVGFPATHPAPTAARVPRPQPARMSTETWGGTWTVRWRWFQWGVLGLAFFCVVWDGFLVFWYSMAFRIPGPISWVMIVFPVGHVTVGVILTYSVLTGFLNTTTVSADGQTLVIRHGPLPSAGNARLGASEIRQLFCRRKNDKEGTAKFQLCAVLSSGKERVLLGGFTDPDELRYLEDELERRLRLDPSPVPGEWDE